MHEYLCLIEEYRSLFPLLDSQSMRLALAAALDLHNKGFTDEMALELSFIDYILPGLVVTDSWDRDVVKLRQQLRGLFKTMLSILKDR